MGLINAVNCNKEDLGLGLGECLLKFGTPKMPILVKKGWRMFRTEFEALTAEGIQALLQQGTFDPVPNGKEFILNTPDLTTQDFTGGIISVTRNAKPQLQFNYDLGISFHKALYSKNSFNKYDMLLTDDSGSLMGALSADGLYVTGITTGMVNTGTYAFKNGDTDANTPFTFQFTNEEQFNKRMFVYTVDQSDIDFNETLNPITSAIITGVSSVANDITIQVRFWSNEGEGVEALDETNFRVVNTVTNAVLPIDAVTNGTNEGDYKIELVTPLTTGTKIKVQLYDATATPPVAVAKLGDSGQFYKGESKELTTVA